MFRPEKELIMLCHCICLDADWVRRYGNKALRTKYARRIKSEATSMRNKIIDDKGKCEICGMSYKPILQIHHILPVSNWGNNDSDNVICVCPNCHKTLHHIYQSFKKTDDIAFGAYVDIPRDIKANVVAVLDVYTKKYDEVYEYIKSYDDSDYVETDHITA